MGVKTYTGSCHCGDVKFQVTADLTNAIECNCSMCHRKGTVLAFVSPDQFQLISGEDALTNYHFNKKVIDHTFCKTCGVTSFATGQDRSGNKIKAINVRCLENLDLKSLQITAIDGRSF